MFLFRRISMLLLSVGCFTGLQADFVTLSVWERTTTLGEKKHIVLLGDRYNLSDQAATQDLDILNFLAKNCLSDDCILDERMHIKAPFEEFIKCEASIKKQHLLRATRILLNISKWHHMQQPQSNLLIICAEGLHQAVIARMFSLLGYECIHDECSIDSSVPINIESSLDGIFYRCIDTAGDLLSDDFRRAARQKDILDGLRMIHHMHQQLQKVQREEKEKGGQEEAKMERRIKHILLGFDVDMDASDQRSLLKLQAKL